MRVKRYEAESMQEAIMKVRAELGRDAVILHSKKFRRGGAFGLFGKQMFEVIAAIELGDAVVGKETRAESKTSNFTESLAREVRAERSENLPAVASETAARAAQVVAPVVTPVPQPVATVAPVFQPTPIVASSLLTAGVETVATGPVMANPVPTSLVMVEPPVIHDVPPRTINWRPEVRVGGVPGISGEAPNNIHSELASLRRMLFSLKSQLNKDDEENSATGGWQEARQLLVDAEVAGKYIDEIEEEIFRQLSDEQLGDVNSVMGAMQECLRQHFLVERRNLSRPGVGPRVIALVGPTGVGKTTTVAKLAAQFSLFSNKSVGLITADTYRIAAVEQLKTYAEIINIPVEVAFTPGEVATALGRLRDKDIVLLDTAGRSQKNEIQMAELKQFLAAAQPTETHLVLSVTTKYRDLLDCLERFREATYGHLIFTKLDETSCYGSIYNCVLESKSPVTYLTCGQNVPDDIVEASRERLTELLLGTGALKQ